MPVWVVGVLIALCGGVAIGATVPLPQVREPTLLPAVAAVPPARGRESEPAGPNADPWPADAPHTIEGSSRVSAGSVPNWRTVAQGAGTVTAVMDTLPAAPSAAIAPLASGFDGESVATVRRGRSVVRIQAADLAAEPPMRTRSADPCAIVIRDASAAEPTGCRAPARRRSGLCPKPNTAAEGATVLCIREPD